MEDYIETISLLAQRNKVVRVRDIAQSLGIKMPSVTSALIKLKEKGLIEYERYGYVELTRCGQSEADRIYDRHSLMNEFLHEVLGSSVKESDDEACRLEHHMNESTFSRFTAFMDFFRKEEKAGAEWVTRLRSVMDRIR